MPQQYAMPCHISDRLYEHTNGWTNCYKLPSEEQLESDNGILAILIDSGSPLYKEMRNHVYFDVESREPGHVGYYKTIPVFIPNLPFKSGAPMRLITNINRQAYDILRKFV